MSFHIKTEVFMKTPIKRAEKLSQMLAYISTFFGCLLPQQECMGTKGILDRMQKPRFSSAKILPDGDSKFTFWKSQCRWNRDTQQFCIYECKLHSASVAWNETLQYSNTRSWLQMSSLNYFVHEINSLQMGFSSQSL